MAYDDALARFEQSPDSLKTETPYRGILYASKLAAQWAAFLDALRIEHAYRAKTVRLASTMHFTADFWLPRLGAWLVVRPADPVLRAAGRWKAELFAREHPASRVWISSGAPRAGEWHIEQLGGSARPVARALLLADADIPAERVWVCGANDDCGRLVYDPVHVAGAPPHVRAGRPADPNRDAVMRMAYSHAECFEGHAGVSLGVLAARRVAHHDGHRRHA